MRSSVSWRRIAIKNSCDRSLSVPQCLVNAIERLIQREIQIRQRFCGYAIGLVKEAQQKALGTDISMLPVNRLLICQRHRFSTTIRKLVTHGNFLLSLVRRLYRPRFHAFQIFRLDLP